MSPNSRESQVEFENAFKAILFYSGRFEVNAKGQVLHHVEFASDLKRIGKTLTRDATLAKGILTLTARGEYGLARVCWRTT